MKKLFGVAVVAVLLALVFLSGCHTRQEVGGVPIDARYTPAYVGIKTDYVYGFDIINGKFALVPEVKQVTTPEKYEILWSITYDDGTSEDKWIECTQAEYEEVHDER